MEGWGREITQWRDVKKGRINKSGNNGLRQMSMTSKIRKRRMWMHYNLPGKHFPCYRRTIWDLFPQLSINLGSALWLVSGLSRSFTENRRINPWNTIQHTCCLWWDNRRIVMESRCNKAADWSEGGQRSPRRTVRPRSSNPPLHCVATSAS